MKKLLIFNLIILNLFCARELKRKEPVLKVEKKVDFSLFEDFDTFSYAFKCIKNRECSMKERDQKGNTALHVAIFYREPYEFKITPAILKEHNKLLKLMIARGADVNAQNNSGCTPMHYVVINFLWFDHYTPQLGAHWYKIAKLLIRKGANVNIKSKEGLNPYYHLLRDDLMYSPISGKYPKQHLRDIKRMELLLKKHLKRRKK